MHAADTATTSPWWSVTNPARFGVANRCGFPDARSASADDVEVFLADLGTRRDRAILLLMLLGGLRASEVRSLRLADIDMGMRQVLVTGKGSKQRLVPVERTLFAEQSGYLRQERPKGLSTPECLWCGAARQPGRR